MNRVGRLTVNPRNLAIVALAAITAFSEPALAQNLVQNFDFSEDGGSFNHYTTNADSFGYFNGTYAAYLTSGDFLTQTIATTPNTTYLVSFVATFGGQGPATFNTVFGTGSLNYSNATGCCSFAPFSFTANATGTSTDLTFTNTDGGSEFVTNLDAEAAPAPIPGAGASSLAIGALGLAGAMVMKRRRVLQNAA